MSVTFDELAPRIAAIRGTIEAGADQSDAARHLMPEIAQAMASAQLYRVGVPVSLQGLECHPVDQIKTIEAVSRIHGSSGWNLMIGIEVMSALSASYPIETLREIFADPDLIISGALNPLGQALQVEGGYQISGQWPFASGIHNAKYFWSQSFIVENGEKVSDDSGPLLCESLVPASDYKILDTWYVNGLRGSGSHDVAIEQTLVPTKYISHLSRSAPYQQGTLYQLPAHSRLAYNKVGVATGIAQAAIEQFRTLATEKKPRSSRSVLAERPDAQVAIAEAERIVGSSRSYVFERINDIWDTVERGDTPTREQRALLQLACSGAASEAVRAVDMLHSAGGISVNFLTSPLERSMRDVTVVRQHIMASPQYTNAIGRVLMGLESGSFLF
jgi:alkylation response protein AidB-like acyl-CoA dehydrogenase